MRRPLTEITVVFALALSCILTMCQPINAPSINIFWVSTQGSDSNPGTEAMPWATLQKAADTVVAGQQVVVLPGTYVGFDIRGKDGTTSQPIIFYAQSKATINERNYKTPDCINIEGVDHVIISGFDIRDSPRVGIRAVLAKGVVIAWNEVTDSYRHGILTGFCTDLTIVNNRVHGTTIEDGIYVSNSNTSPDNILVADNEISGTKQTGIHVNGDCDAGGDGIIENIIIERNYVHDCGDKGMDFISVRDSRIQNNIFAYNGVQGIGAGAIHLADEAYVPCNLPSINNVIVNNTIYENEIAGIRFTNGSTDNVCFNNLVISLNDPRIDDEVGGNHIDHNVLLTKAKDVFIDLPNRNFKPDYGSPAIDSGVPDYIGEMAPTEDYSKRMRPYGGQYDCGAFERYERSTDRKRHPHEGTER